MRRRGKEQKKKKGREDEKGKVEQKRSGGEGGKIDQERGRDWNRWERGEGR